MAAISTPARSHPGPISTPAWVSAVLAVSVSLLWLVTMEGQAVSQAIGGTSRFLHELFHDGRHLLGVPCH